MATTTPRFGLEKPDLTDDSNPDVAGWDDNWTVIDANLGARTAASTARGTSHAGAVLRESDTGNLVIGTGTAWVHEGLPKASSTAAVTNPWPGMLVWSTGDEAVFRYTGSAWVMCLAAGGARRETRLYATTWQSTSNGTDTEMIFDGVIYSSPDVTVAAFGNFATINRGGVWIVTAGVRWPVLASGAGRRQIQIAHNMNAVAGSTDHVGSADSTTQQARAVVAAQPGDTFRVWINQSNSLSDARQTDGGFPGYKTFSLTWLHA